MNMVRLGGDNELPDKQLIRQRQSRQSHDYALITHYCLMSATDCPYCLILSGFIW